MFGDGAACEERDVRSPLAALLWTPGDVDDAAEAVVFNVQERLLEEGVGDLVVARNGLHALDDDFVVGHVHGGDFGGGVVAGEVDVDCGCAVECEGAEGGFLGVSVKKIGSSESE